MFCWLGWSVLWAQAGLDLGPNEVLSHRIKSIEVHTWVLRDSGELQPSGRALYQYDLRGHLVSREVYDRGGQRICSFETNFDLSDHRTYRTVSSQGSHSTVQWDLTYDPQQRLIAAQDNGLGLLRRYRYDAKDRVRTILISYDVESAPISVERFAYDEAGRVRWYQDRSELMIKTVRTSYDAEGRRLETSRHTHYEVPGEVDKYRRRRYHYDKQGHLIRVDTYGAQGDRTTSMTLEYDRNDQLVVRQVGDQHLVYLRDEQGLIVEQQRYRDKRLVAREKYRYQGYDPAPIATR